jgi:protein TonB
MKINQPIIISFLLHACLLLLLLLTPNSNTRRPQKQDVEIVYQNEKNSSKQFVTSPDTTDPKEKLNEALKKLNDSVKRLSKYTKRVAEESTARRSGPTQNANQNSRPQNPEPAQSQMAARDMKQKVTEENSGNLPMPKQDLFENKVARDTHLSYSTNSDYLPDVKNGGFTALNSDQFMYYTFYSRINDQLRNRWVSLIRQYLDSTPQMSLNQLANRTQVTQLEVLLTPDGRFLKAMIYQKADAIKLDEIAVSAFRQAAPFNNPPSDIVAKDGFVHLQYALYLELSPRYMANGSR